MAGLGGGAGGAGRGGAGPGGAGPGGGPGIAPCPPQPSEAPCQAAGTYCSDGRTGICFCTGRTWFCFNQQRPASAQEALTGAYRGQDNQDCLACAEGKCSAPIAAFGCTGIDCPSVKLLACQLETGCALTPGGVASCYCGTTAGHGTDCLYTNDQDGACAQEEKAGISYTSPLGIASQLFASSAASGVANNLVQCLLDQRCASCFRSHQDNSCPQVMAVDIGPTPAMLGRTIALRAAAIDADGGPSPLSYEWTADSSDVGDISNAHTANAGFACKAAGYAIVTLTISDGDAGCDFTSRRLVSCLQPVCASAEPLVTSSLAAFTGGSVELSADVLDRTGVPAAFDYAWSASPDGTGVITTDDTAAATFTCSSPGIATASVTGHAGGDGCPWQLSRALACVAPDGASGRPTPETTEAALLGSVRGENNQACLACAVANRCVDPAPNGKQPCEYRRDPAERALCLRLLECELESGCGNTPPGTPPDLADCYCSRHDGCFIQDGDHDGACSAEIQAALQMTDPSDIGGHLLDLALPAGQADLLTECLAYYGCASCFPASPPAGG